MKYFLALTLPCLLVFGVLSLVCTRPKPNTAQVVSGQMSVEGCNYLIFFQNKQIASVIHSPKCTNHVMDFTHLQLMTSPENK